MGINIGLTAIINRDKYAIKQMERFNFSCDWITLEFLEDFVPVIDANMMRIYAREFGKNIDGMTDEEISAYGDVYKKQIHAFIYDNLFNRISKIIDRVKSNANEFNSIPTNAKPAFDDYLTFAKLNPEANDTNQFVRFKSELIRNAEDWFKSWHEDLDASRYIIPSEKFIRYVEIVERKMEDCFHGSTIQDTIAIDFQQKIKNLIDHVKTLLLLRHQIKVENHKMSKDFFDKDLMLSYGKFRRYTDAVIPYVEKFNAVKPSHAICIYASNIDVKLKLVEEPSGFDNTDEYRFMVASITQELINNDPNKSDDLKVAAY